MKSMPVCGFYFKKKNEWVEKGWLVANNYFPDAYPKDLLITETGDYFSLWSEKNRSKLW